MSYPTPSTDHLVKVLIEAKAPADMIERAKNQRYNDYLSISATPIRDLVKDLEQAGLVDLANRARGGEFDADRDEAEAWAASPDGKDAIDKIRRPS